MALEVQRESHLRQRQEQLNREAQEAIEAPLGSISASQSPSLGRRFKQASAMEAQVPQGLGQGPATYGSPNPFQIEKHGGQQSQPPPRTSSSQRTTTAIGSATASNERVRGPRDYQFPTTPKSKNQVGQDQANNPKPNTATSDANSPAGQAPVEQQQNSTPLPRQTRSSQMQEAHFPQTPEQISSTTQRQRSRESRSYDASARATSPAANPHRTPRVESDKEGRSYQHYIDYSSPVTQERSKPVVNTPRESGPRYEPNPIQPARSSTNPESAETSRESGEILNRVVISDPEVDVKREEERIEEAVPTGHQGETTPKATKRRQEFSTNAAKRKEVKFGEYILGQTLGEGEFGKVKLGWKKDGSVEVAIKLIRRENLNANPTRLPKIYREVNILRGLQHPNIVRLHEMLETDRYIGIVMECASGGELFDYILHHRYLKDNPAKKLFAQLVSGVGYLHKKGIVHRDLKLENLLLDRHRNIIITDFGFANSFNPADELGEDIEVHITDKAWVKKYDLDRIDRHTGFRRGDLMATSCGSPCYAAPELVVTDSLYTGRKVDVWSCGVILYAMLAGYLPFDDDPANPEGDNINLLYKYIVSTPLTFPEYVSPHSRDLLRRMLVPDPRKRADLFEIARHSWLSEYAGAIAQYTSMSVDTRALPILPIASERNAAPSLARSASVREPGKPHTTMHPAVGGLSHQGKLDAQMDSQKTPRDPKRRTVQVEYVAPQSQTTRGEDPVPSDGQRYAPGPTAMPINESIHQPSARKPLPQDPVTTTRGRPSANAADGNVYQPQHGADMAPPPTRPMRDPPRSTTDSTSAFGHYPINSTARPNTRGSISSANGGRLPSRGNSYGQPLAPAVAATNAEARLAQPKGPRYNISAPIPQPEPFIPNEPGHRPTSQRLPVRQAPAQADTNQGKGHKRSSTLSNIFGKPGSLFGGNKSQIQTRMEAERPQKKYPPTSMKAPIVSGATAPRTSSESRRTSFGFSRKSSDVSRQEKPRRFSLLPPSFSLRNFSTSPKDTSSIGLGSEPNIVQYEQVNSPASNEQQPVPRNISEPVLSQPRTRVLQKSQRNFSEAYDQDDNARHAGTSGPARRVMDFFRRRGRARAGED